MSALVSVKYLIKKITFGNVIDQFIFFSIVYLFKKQIFSFINLKSII